MGNTNISHVGMPNTRPTRGGLPGVPRGEDRQQVANSLFVDEPVSERLVSVDRVMVATTGPHAEEVARRRELVDNPVRGTFGHTNPITDLAKAQARILGDAQKDAGVVGQKRPRRCLWRRHLFLEYSF